MSKNFGYSNTGGKHWFNSAAYSDNEIGAIKDPEGGREISLPTAIPSPFARIDLFKTAFKNISNTAELRASQTASGVVLASKNDEKLVSDCFDIAEMMFNYNSIRDKIRIIVWDKDVELGKLKSGSDKHRRFAETLELYFDQDRDSYNFNRISRLYLIEYDFKIIGCTSPVTLFFVTANDLKRAQIKLTGTDVLFDQSYAPLYERDPEFQKYFYLLFKAHPELSNLMRDFYRYLQRNLEILEQRDPRLYAELNTLKAEDYKELYAELTTGNAGSNIEVLGVELRKRKSEDVIEYISKHSEFRIAANPSKNITSNIPLVLQNDFTKSWLYAKDQWQKVPVPFIENTGMDRRILPGINVQYPYLTISDFFEPYLIRMVYPINKDKFFDGNLIAEVGDDSKGYILPLKKQFFDYFTAEDLISAAPGKPSIKMVQGVANSVKVILKIPVTKPGEYITFERTYFESVANQISKPEEENNKGVIVEQQVGVTLFPFIKTNDDNLTPFYRVQLIDRDVTGNLKQADYDLSFFSNKSNDAISIRAKKIRSKKPDAGATSQYYVLDNEFDFIQLRNQTEPETSGIIIPNWQPYEPGGDIFSFAIDFGTTNTHIEYKVGGGAPKPFDITPDDIQVATLFHPTKTTEDFGATGAIAIRELIEHELVPQLLGNKSDYKFPHRTVIAQSHSLNIQNPTFSLADFNIPFIYERKAERDKIISNLKWAKKEPGNQIRVERFLENIIMLLRNKVLMNKGNLSATRLVWFYPSSMKPVRKSGLETTWNKLFTQYFNPINEPVGITESLAPFFYFKGVNKLQGGEVVSIDIGGGTTDVVVFKSKNPLLLTSFKFAANTIFGDGFSEYGAANTNGLINKYFPHYETLLGTNKLYDLSKVLSSIKDKNVTEDINAFFFSIENNPKIDGKELYSYNRLLSVDEDLKIVFLYFYAAIIYHVAKLMKIKNLPMPKHLVFSGTGSKILTIITPDLRTTLAKFSMKIFERVYDQKFGAERLTIETEKEMPKEVTCKGGLMLNPEDLKIDTNEIKAILTCLEHKDINHLSMDRLDNEAKNEIVKFVSEFNSFFLEINRDLSFKDYFGISQKSLEIFRNEANKYLKDHLEEGLEYNRKLDEAEESDKEIEETLFFYPIIGTINTLIGHLSVLTPVND
jgi:hypothetical protein